MKKGFVTETVIAAYCSDCGDQCEGDTGGLVFASVEAASDPESGVPAYGWEIDGDLLTCDNCQGRVDCSERGHAWLDWRTITTKVDGREHAKRVRRCDRCWDREVEVLS
ncbi:hypothetical protein [Nocardia sp. NPDC056100]|uniref:hypothetical protein n=1 Tax=Nocardia sp. NPDC056100 TaxID=3345712 RepID=UPI0035D73BF4